MVYNCNSMSNLNDCWRFDPFPRIDDEKRAEHCGGGLDVLKALYRSYDWWVKNVKGCLNRLQSLGVMPTVNRPEDLIDDHNHMDRMQIEVNLVVVFTLKPPSPSSTRLA